MILRTHPPYTPYSTALAHTPRRRCRHTAMSFRAACSFRTNPPVYLPDIPIPAEVRVAVAPLRKGDD